MGVGSGGGRGRRGRAARYTPCTAKRDARGRPYSVVEGFWFDGVMVRQQKEGSVGVTLRFYGDGELRVASVRIGDKYTIASV